MNNALTIAVAVIATRLETPPECVHGLHGVTLGAEFDVSDPRARWQLIAVVRPGELIAVPIDIDPITADLGKIAPAILAAGAKLRAAEAFIRASSCG